MIPPWKVIQQSPMRWLQHSSLQLPHIGHAWLMKPTGGAALLDSHITDLTREQQQQRLQQIEAALGCPALCFLQQRHGTKVCQVTADMSLCVAEGDALFTTQPDVALMILHADCLPILIAHRHQPMICAIHAGWRGLMEGVIPQAVSRVLAEGVAAEDLVAVIGPHLGPASAEYRDYQAYFPQWSWGYCLGGSRFPLGKIAADQLMTLGLLPTAISISTIDTASSSDSFFSYRGACRGDAAGRNAAILWLI